MVENPERIGAFTSSEIHKLMKLAKNKIDFGEPALTYINDKKIERRLGRSINTDVCTRDMTWGKFLERRVFDMLGFEYEFIVSDSTQKHPTIEGWAGSRDLFVKNLKVSDIKCYQPKNFALITDIMLLQDVDLLKEEFPNVYWQLVSNACISEVPNAEIITYMPYLSELPDIALAAQNYEGPDQYMYRFIYEGVFTTTANDGTQYISAPSLAYLPDGGYYKNLNIFEFKVPQEDFDLLTSTVTRAIELLN